MPYASKMVERRAEVSTVGRGPGAPAAADEPEAAQLDWIANAVVGLDFDDAAEVTEAGEVDQGRRRPGALVRSMPPNTPKR
jgi:hypothetical protein